MESDDFEYEIERNLTYDRYNLVEYTPLLGGWVIYFHNILILVLFWTAYKVQRALYRIFTKAGQRHLNTIVLPLVVSKEKNKTYTAQQKHESTLLHMYVLNEFLTADRSCTSKYF